MRPLLVAFAAAAGVAGCTMQAPGTRAPVPSSEPTAGAAGNYTVDPASTFGELRSRPIRLPTIPPGGCPVSNKATIHFEGGITRLANGTAPFYFGPWDGFSVQMGDGNKTPWTVAPGYTGRILVRGGRIDGPGNVAFGFWPRGFGTPADAPDVPILFKRTDSEGRTTVYQPELDIDAPAGGRSSGHFWSFPSAGCYAIQADGDTFTHVTVISVL